MICPFLHINLSDRVDNHDGIGTVPSDSLDELIAILPCRQVIPISLIAVDGDVSLARIRLDKRETHGCLLSGGSNKAVVVIIEDPLTHAPVLSGSSLKRFHG